MVGRKWTWALVLACILILQIGSFRVTTSQEAFDFALSANPDTITVTAGDSATSTITVELIGGSPQEVALSCSGPFIPFSVSCIFDPPTLTPTGSSTLTISTSTDFFFQTFITITIEGIAGDTVRSTQISLTIDPLLREIHGVKFADVNGNGIRDAGEPGIPDWTIFLCCTNEGQISTLTDDQGRYSFTELEPFRSYFVSEEFKPDFVKSAPIFFGHNIFFFGSEKISAGNNFGNMPFSPGEIHGTKFADFNGNGISDPNELGLSGWKIELETHDQFGFIESTTTTTDEMGEYSFTNVPFGLHTVTELPQEGFQQTAPKVGDFSWTDNLYPLVISEESLSSKSLSSETVSGAQMKQWRGIVHRSNTTGITGVEMSTIMPLEIETFEDPVGDTFGSFGGPKIDIASVGAHYADDSLTITMTFADPLSHNPFFDAPNIGGFVDIDADMDASTGALPFQNFYGLPPSTKLGDEFFIELFAFDGTVPVVAPLGFNFFSIIAYAPIVFSENSFTITLPECIFGGKHFNYGAVVGSFTDLATDEVANDTVLTSTGSPSCTNPPRFVPIIRSGEIAIAQDFGNRPPNSPPVAEDDAATTDEGVAVTINVLANDSDLDGDALSVQSVTQSASGSVVINLDNTITYTPNAGFSGIDSFDYTLSDGKGGSDTASVTVTVTTMPCGKPIGAFASVIDGMENDDTLIGSSGNDLIRGFGGNDRIEGRGGHDCLIGGEGNDTMFGNGGNDMIEGEDGNDAIAGGGGHDVINGGKGNDSIKGNAGNDTMDGGEDSDTCRGGAGSNIKNNCEA